MEIKVLMVDDHEIVRESVRLLLESGNRPHGCRRGRGRPQGNREGFRPGTGRRAHERGYARLERHRGDSTDTETGPDAKVLAFSGYSEKRYVSGMLQAGASGYLLKKTSVSDLMNGIRARPIRGYIGR